MIVKTMSQHKRRMLMAGGVVLFAALAAALVLMLSHQAKQNRYVRAEAMMERGDYTEAEAAFEALSGFRDAPEKAAYCRDAVRYRDAEVLLAEGQYEAAKALFVELGDFKDAGEQSVFCDQSMSLKAAEQLMAGRHYAEAEKAFRALGDFKNASEQADLCGQHLDFEKAESLLKDGLYGKAKALYKNLSEQAFPTAKAQYTFCQNKENYATAQQQYEDGYYYDAYQGFGALGTFEDSAERQSACVQSFPDTGEVYRNADYTGGSLYLNIVPPSEDGSRNYIKIYTADDVLVSCVAIGAGSQGRVSLPAGTYRIKNAYGYGDWFGEKDLFGDEGYYLVLKNNKNATQLFEMESGYEYTLNLRTGKPGGDPVSSETEDRKTL